MSLEVETRAYPADLEVRRVGDLIRKLVGLFRFGVPAVIADRGSTRKEIIEPGAFDFAIDSPTHDIHLLIGHDFNRPLASKLAGTLRFWRRPGRRAFGVTEEGLAFEADLPPVETRPAYIDELLRQVESGLVGGVSPGFRIPPASAVADPEVLKPEPGNPGVNVRHVRQAVLYELSIVTRPAYPETDVDLRAMFAGDQRAAQSPPAGDCPQTDAQGDCGERGRYWF